MFNVCPRCGSYRVDKAVEPVSEGMADALCPDCGHRRRFRQLPLYVITGASGSGKSTIALRLPDALPELVTLEMDILWRPSFNEPVERYQDFFDLWLRMAKNISQSERPVALAGSVTPEQLETRPERRYLAEIHYLALVASDAVIESRLRERRAWRRSGSDAIVGQMVAFNAWLRDNADATSPPMTVLDTSTVDPDAAASAVAAWARRGRADQPG